MSTRVFAWFHSCVLAWFRPRLRLIASGVPASDGLVMCIFVPPASVKRWASPTKSPHVAIIQDSTLPDDEIYFGRFPSPQTAMLEQMA